MTGNEAICFMERAAHYAGMDPDEVMLLKVLMEVFIELCGAGTSRNNTL